MFSKIEFLEAFTSAVVIDIVFISVTIIAAAANFEELKPLLSFNGVKASPLLAMTAGAIVFSSLLNIIMPFVKQWLSETDYNYYYAFAGSPFPLTFLFVSIAVIPGIFEEIAFRGFIFNNLLDFTGKQTTLLVTALLFSILHLTFLSLLWLIPFAYILGWARLKYNTLWYGIAAHITFNATTCLFDLYHAGLFDTMP